MIDEKALLAGQRAAMESNGCGYSWDGVHVFCDDLSLLEPYTSCQCKKDARAAITAYEAAKPVAAGDLVSRAEVLRVLKRLGDQDADLALYGAEDNARAREYGEAAMTRACCAVAIMPASRLASLEAARSAEPVAWRVKDYADGWILCHSLAHVQGVTNGSNMLVQPLYAHPKEAPDV